MTEQQTARTDVSKSGFCMKILRNSFRSWPRASHQYQQQLAARKKECAGLSGEEAGRGSHEDPGASVSRTLSIPEGRKPSGQRALNLLPFRPFYGLHLEEKNKDPTINRKV